MFDLHRHTVVPWLLAIFVWGVTCPAVAEETIPQGLQCLQTAYPDHICNVQPNALVWCDGTVMPFEDGRQPADHANRLANPDLADQMHQPYSTVTGPDWRPAPNDDPGRTRF